MSTLEITRRNGQRFLVHFDEADRDLVMQYRWRILPSRTPGRNYAQASVGNTTVRMHQLICGRGADHINGNGLDNRRSNLRPATPGQNAANRKATRSDGVKGVTFHKKSGKWQAAIAKRYLGLFATQEEAAAAYDAAARDLWGDYARTNGVAA